MRKSAGRRSGFGRVVRVGLSSMVIGAVWMGIAVAGAGSVDHRTHRARTLAASSGWSEGTLDAGEFHLKVWQPDSIRGSAGVLRVYIEGDGFAWVSRDRPSIDPTPRNPVALRLALLDPNPATVYLARPCQYVLQEAPGACRESYWTDERFSEAVIRSMDRALEALKAAAGAQRVELVGYSGGGAVAALVAARREDVISLMTVAGNLDTEEVSRIHRVSPLKNSLNPMGVAHRIRGIPQVHFVGAADKVVTPVVAERFRAASGAPDRVRIRIIEGVSHDTGWAERWPELLADAPE
jgi:dienelactone hydrolase